MIYSRLSVVDHVRFHLILYSSILQVGDTVICHPKCQAFSLQREYPIFRRNEISAFNHTWKPLPPPPNITNPVNKRTKSSQPIHVGTVNITSLTGSSIVHIGSTSDMSPQAQLKHVRNFLYPRSELIKKG